MNPALHTRICDLFGIEVPIIQTGMGWVAGPRLCAAPAAVRLSGALGISVCEALRARATSLLNLIIRKTTSGKRSEP